MAPVYNVLRTCGLLLYFIVNIVAFVRDNQKPWILKLEVLRKNCAENSCKYLLNVHGGEFLGYNSWRLTPERGDKGGDCDKIYPNYDLREISTLQWATTIEVTVPEENGKIYFCLRFSEKKDSPFGGKWSHQGDIIFLDPKHDGVSANKEKLRSTTERQKESLEDTEWVDLSHDIDVNYLPSIKRPVRKNVDDIEIFDDTLNVLEGIVDNDTNFVRKKPDTIYDWKYEFDKSSVDVSEEINSQKIIQIDNNKINKDSNNYYIDDLSRKLDVDGERIQDIVKSENSVRYIHKKNQAEVSNKEVLKTILEKVNITHKNNKNQDEDSLPASKVRRRREIVVADKNVNTFANDNTRSKLVSDEFDKDKTNLNEESNDNEIIVGETVSRGIVNVTKNEGIMIIDKNRVFDKETEISMPKRKENKRRYKRSTHLFHVDSTKRFNDFIDSVDNDTRLPIHSDFTTVKADSEPIAINIDGIRIEDSEKEPKIIGDGIPSVLADSRVTLRLFGDGLTSRTVIAFTNYPPLHGPGEPCKFILKGEYMTNPASITGKTALFDIIAPPTDHDTKLYLCVKNLRPDTDLSLDEDKYIHQGSESYKIFATHNKLLPLWVTLTLILICLTFSALFSGLNLGLMSLDRTELKIISNTGTEQERKYARAIMPVRDHGNYLLCSILLGNVAVNSTFTILLDELTSGLFAVIFSTLAIVLLGEITPQAICSRHGLMVGAKSIMITKAVMALTAPLAFPVSKLLDYFLGEEIGNVYNRERLKELVKVTTGVNDLDKDEVNIISGALELRKKTVSDVMTKLEDVFMLPISSVLDFETMSEIIKSGYSRIPVYEGSRGNIVTVLFIKDLAFVDPDDNTPLKTLCQYYQNVCNFVFEDVTLDVMFKQFKDGHKGHMAFVHRINNEGECDPFYETIGLVTLEDVIEEMIQSEIVDETDVFMDNRTKRRRNRPEHKLQDFAAFAERHENQRIHISPQLTLATFQFLSTSVDAFRPDTVSETVLRRLLKQDVIQYIKLKGKTKKDPSTYVFQQGKPVDYFVLILEGRVEVTVGRENLVFEAGPFTYFGVQALTQNIGVAESPTPSAMGSLQNINMDSMLRHTFVPDYSVRAVTELYYLTVKRSLYLAAKRATLMEKGALSKGGTAEQFDTEVDKHLCNSTANIPISMISKKLLGKSNSSFSAHDADVYGSTSTGNKVSPRLNIIELQQITTQNPSSERLETNSLDKHSTNASRCIVQNYMPITNKCLANMSTNSLMCDRYSPNNDKCLPNMSTKSLSEKHWSSSDKCFTNACDATKSMARANHDTRWSNHIEFAKCSTHSNMSSKLCDIVDTNVCDECVRNNFWMDKSALSKIIQDDKFNDPMTKIARERGLVHRSPPDGPDVTSRRGDIRTNNRHATGNQLLQSVDEDISISGDHKTSSRQVSPNPVPVSASPITRASFTSRASPEPRNGDMYAGARADEQEKLLK